MPWWSLVSPLLAVLPRLAAASPRQTRAILLGEFSECRSSCNGLLFGLATLLSASLSAESLFRRGFSRLYTWYQVYRTKHTDLFLRSFWFYTLIARRLWAADIAEAVDHSTISPFSQCNNFPSLIPSTLSPEMWLQF